MKVLKLRTHNSTPKIISSEKAASLLERGWRKADMHVHTCCSHDVPPAASMRPENLFKKAKAAGFDHITFTDHDTVKAYDILGWNKEDLVSGVELSLKDTQNVGHTVHINVFGFDKQQYAEFDKIAREDHDIYGAIDYFKSHGLAYTYNHPFWFEVGDKPNIFAIPELARYFPVIEYNMQDLKQKNLFAAVLAQRYGKGMAVTSDSHTGSIGKVYTIAKGDSFEEYFANVSKGNSYMVIDAPIWKHITWELNAWVELAFDMDRDVREEAFTTGVGVFDKMVDLIAGDLNEKSPLVGGIAKGFFKQISGSGLPFLLYRMLHQPEVSRIGRVIGSKVVHI